MTSNPNVVNTVQENAQHYLSLVNQQLADAGVTNDDGSSAQFKMLAGSPTWLLMLAMGQAFTEWQERGNVIYNALNIEACEDEQVENLALLSGLTRRLRTATFITVLITNAEDQTIVINSRNSTFTDSVYSYEWYIGQNLTLAKGDSARVQLYCSTTNDVSLPANTSFTATPLIEDTWSSFTCLSTGETIQGTADETIAELRNRVMVGTSQYSAINKTQDAIAQLSGISKCSIYFNVSSTDSMPLKGGITVPIRQCLVVIRGADATDLLAKTYFEYMDVQSYNPGSAHNVQVSYVRIGALDMPVYYLQATTIPVYVRVTVDISASDVNYAGYIKAKLSAKNGTTEVGENLTTKMVSVWLNEIADYVNVVTVELSDDGETWASTTDIPCYNVADIDTETIQYVAV